jgi:hypothetical protein
MTKIPVIIRKRTNLMQHNLPTILHLQPIIDRRPQKTPTILNFAP